jgi:hypothetical protein
MDFNINEGRFTHKGLSTPIFEILKVKGIVQGKNINVVICPYKKENYINIDIANQLSILESNIIEKNFGKTQIKNLQVTIDGYKYISEFDVTKMTQPDVGIILGSTWLETLGTFILNVEKKIFDILLQKEKNYAPRHNNDVTFKSSIIRRF